MSYKFSAQHQWIKEQSPQHCVGITDHAQETLGDVVFVQLPAVGAHFQQNEVVCAVESLMFLHPYQALWSRSTHA